MRSRVLGSYTFALAAISMSVGIFACEESAPAPTVAGGPAPVRSATTPNAAAEYLRIVDDLGPGYMDPFSDFYDIRSLTPDVEAALIDLQPQIRDLIRASRIARCEFDVDYGDGMATLLPHLSKVRGLVRLLRADALRLTLARDRPAAAERLAAMVRIGRHFASGRIIIEKLVGMAVIGLSCSTIDSLLEPPVIDARGKQTLLTELHAIDSADPLGARSAVRGEREVIVAAIRNNRGFDVAIGRTWAMIPAREHPAIADEVDRLLRRLEAAWDHPSATQEMESISADIEHRAVRLLLPDVAKYKEQVERLRTTLRATITSLER